MENLNVCSLLLSDTYKQCHDRMYPADLQQLVSYWTPRKAMSEDYTNMVFAGIQPFLIALNKEFEDNFFSKSINEVLIEYERYMCVQLTPEAFDIDKIVKLHELSYLPLEIRALPEGTVVNMGVPCIEMTNTVDGFAWLVQWLECLLQTELWAPCGYATIGHEYRKIANYYYDKTVCGMSPAMAMADFGMRGMSCLEDGIRTSAAWLMSFDKTSTIPALAYLDKYYDADVAANKIGIGAVSTEHSVMGANFALDGDEITFVKRMLTELYPNTSFSMVSDTYDYWNMIDNILPACKEEIMAHNGKLLVRPDSGDMVDIAIRTINKLWDTFGGTVNEKGYKVLDPHIGIIYGDGCAIAKVTEIYNILDSQGFAANNIVFGVGAFCFHGFFEKSGKFIALTRDTWGIAMKATYGRTSDEIFPIYKDPKTDTTHLKKSHKGCCQVVEREDGFFDVFDGFMDPVIEEQTALKTMYRDGELLNFSTFAEIRERVNGGN